ncbi:hypothetical protein NCCP2716_16920 [Sporosarcina sp. NCCP-2716]|uniref:nuclease-related domain-containing protein n=1 Tax=Sporosarcina sp. NCCP-2716 TaxID=2943679 RepID=UPI00203A7DDC|nr:nuclease-related domain-containing protein [Sporosarcina sp. NCCP-2716]GKV69194.1 hypothetical protein NCCP2716_16920 [Sporosarcina sp. NCCP-2716]
MLYKPRKTPKELIALLALEKRIAPTHPQYPLIYQEMYKMRAGFGGEQEYDRHMKEVRTDYPHAILHDLSLQQEGVYFQIDSLFIAPDAIIISEIKNRTGKIIIKANPTQFLQSMKESEPSLFRSPIDELERKRQLLERWLAQRNIMVPIQCITIFAHNNILEFSGKTEIPILTGYEAPIFFRGRETGPHLLDKRRIEKLAAALVQQDKPYPMRPLSTRFSIKKEELVKGVWCPECPEKTILYWRHQRWNCGRCSKTSLTEHETTIDEWFMLITPTITNKEFCEFTGLRDRHIAKRLLARSKVYRRGERAGSVYVPLKN